MNSLMIEGTVAEKQKDSFILECRADDATGKAMNAARWRPIQNQGSFFVMAAGCSKSQMEAIETGQHLVVTGIAGGAFVFRANVPKTYYMGCQVIGMRMISARRLS